MRLLRTTPTSIFAGGRFNFFNTPLLTGNTPLLTATPQNKKEPQMRKENPAFSFSKPSTTAQPLSGSGRAAVMKEPWNPK